MIVEALVIFHQEATATVLDLVPIVVLIGFFQLAIIRRRVPNLPRIVAGLAYVALGLALFRIGIEESLIPVGRDMARQLVQAAFATGGRGMSDYLPILAFAGLIGFTATMLEPTLIAAASRVQTLSGGALRARMLRVVISCGVALGLVLGTLRILTGMPLSYLLTILLVSLILLALTAPREIVPLALDSGGIATSVVTVPLIAAYGVAVAEAMPNRATAADGFGLIVLALLSPVVLLLAFALLQTRFRNRAATGGSDAVQTASRAHR